MAQFVSNLATAQPMSRFELYERLRRELDADTLAHIKRTAVIARELAAAHGIDPERAELAAMLHDVADRYSERELLQLAEKYGIEVNLTEARVPQLLHGKVGAEILRAKWGITDDEILDAVRFHLSGSATMGDLAKVLFVADKIEPDRDKFYHDLGPVREIAMRNLDEAILRLYAWRMNQLVTSGKAVHEDLSTARNAIIERARARLR